MGGISQFFENDFYFRRAQGQLRTGDNRGEGAVVIEKEKKIRSLSYPNLNASPIIKKVFHNFLYHRPQPSQQEGKAVIIFYNIFLLTNYR